MRQVYTITFASIYFYYKAKRIIVVWFEYKERCILINISKATTLTISGNIYEFIISMSYSYKHIASQHHHNTMLLTLSYYCMHAYNIMFIIQIFTKIVSEYDQE